MGVVSFGTAQRDSSRHRRTSPNLLMANAFDPNAFDLNAFDAAIASGDGTAVISDGIVIHVSVGNATASGTGAGGSSGTKRRPGRIAAGFVYEPTGLDAVAKIERGIKIKVSVGFASAIGSATATPNGITIHINVSDGITARGIQNPTDEELLALLEAA